MNPVHFSSKRQDWGTPSDFFAKLHAEFDFDVDVCATPGNAKLQWFYCFGVDDGLAQAWHEEPVCWMNPPYGREISKWTRKAAAEAVLGATVVGLLPSRTDTRWWHEDVIRPGAEVRFVRGRLTFEGAEHPAPFPSAVVIWRPK